MTAKAAMGSSSLSANQRCVFSGIVSSPSEKAMKEPSQQGGWKLPPIHADQAIVSRVARYLLWGRNVENQTIDAAVGKQARPTVLFVTLLPFLTQEPRSPISYTLTRLRNRGNLADNLSAILVLMRQPCR
jgi:hypothetical protein